MSLPPPSIQEPVVAAWPASIWVRLGRYARPGLLLYWILLTLATLWPNLDLGVPQETQQTYHPDKFVHFFSFGLLTVLIIAALSPRRLPRGRSIALGVALGAAYGALNEWLQLYSPGREFSYGDVMANVAGALAAGYLVGFYTINRWISDHRVTICRILLLIALPALAYVALHPDFLWRQHVTYRWLVSMGWQRGAFFPYSAIAHVLAAMLLTWLVPAARPFGERQNQRQTALLILLVAAIAVPLEWAQMLFGRSPFINLGDILWHQVGVAAALVIWLLVAAMRVQAGPSRRSSDSFVGHALTVSLLTLVSRFTGVVRDAAMGAVFGLTGVMGAFTIGFMVPNLFRRLFGEGALTAAFIPVYAEQLKNDPLLARRLASLCIGVLLLVTGLLTLLGIAVLYAMEASRDWSPSAALAIELSRLMLPFMPMVCLVALLGGILQVHGRFAPSAAAPIIVNLGMIVAALLAAFILHNGLDVDDARRAIRLVAFSVLVAGAVQVIWQVAAVLRIESFTLRCRNAWHALKPVVLVMIPMVMGLAVFQINALFDTLIAFGLAPPDTENGRTTFTLLGWTLPYPIEQRGDAAALAFAQRLYQFPLGVFGIAVATAIFPALAHAAIGRSMQGADRGEYRTILQHGLRLTMFIGLPAGVGLMFVRLPLTRAIFEYNRFDLEASMRVATILAGYAAAIWAYSMTHVLTRAFYAVKDARTPLRISIGMVTFNLALNMILIWFLGAAGLAWSTSTTAVVQTIILLLTVRRYVAQPVDRAVWQSWGKTAMLTLVMAVALWLPLTWYDPAALDRSQSLLLLIAMVSLGMAVFLLGAWLTRSQELQWLIRRDSNSQTKT